MIKSILYMGSLMVFCLAGNGISHAQYNISNFAGNGLIAWFSDGPATSTGMSPINVSTDISGNVYIAAESNDRIYKVTAGGTLTTITGNGSPGFSGDGGTATSAQVSNSAGVAVDATGNVYIADTYNHRIRKISGGIITTIAGNGIAGFSGDGGPADSASLHYPVGVAVDGSGNVYIADRDNNRIRKVSIGGIITTYAGMGTAGYSGDGSSAISAQINKPNDVAVDALGNVYIADKFNSRIRKVTSGGTISTFAGTGTTGFSGDGGAASAANIWEPEGVGVDALGNVFIADTKNHRIRRVNTGGTITTIAGNGIPGFSGDGGAATSAKLYYPSDVTGSISGKIYIADFNNNRVRVLNSTVGIEENYDANNLSVYPNPTGGIVNVELTHNVSEGIKMVSITNFIGEIIWQQEVNMIAGSPTLIDISSLASGVYTMHIDASNQRIIKQ